MGPNTSNAGAVVFRVPGKPHKTTGFFRDAQYIRPDSGNRSGFCGRRKDSRRVYCCPQHRHTFEARNNGAVLGMQVVYINCN